MSALRIAPSLLAADFARLADALLIAEEGGADLIHVDVMDGHFVPNLTIGPPVVRSLRAATRRALDVHLMIDTPERSLAEYLDAGADWISVHVEATSHLQRCLSEIRKAGARAGAVLNPATPPGALAACWNDLDYAVVMSVNPGWGGQPLLPGSIEKIRRLRAEASEAGVRLMVEVDGGVDANNAGALAAAGAEILVAGTAIYGAGDPAGAIGQLRAAAEGVRA
ncbi:MAG: ribulose-phosphate 3-epimerase [Acidobacteria bacterium]|nr:MAG: ribulose-phosphate 3-epimerase [Acidobacteriota bacterium]